MLETFIGQGLVGQAIKHLVPWDGVNKFIPAFNAIAGTAYNMSKGLDWQSAATYGVVGMLSTMKAKDKLKEKLGDRQFKGIGTDGGFNFTIVDRKF